MIDYKKLEMAHCLALKSEHEITVQLTVTKDEFYYRLLTNNNNSDFFDFEDEDSLLRKLNEIVLEQKVRELKINKPDHSLPQQLWLQDCDRKVISVYLDAKQLKYNADKECYEATNGWNIPTTTTLYASRQALIEAQIKYWTSQSENT